MEAKTFTRKIGLNRGKPRLWLEGKILDDNGFKHGTVWDAVVFPDPTNPEWPSIDLVAGPLGKRKVAGAEGRPIIDINSKNLLIGFTAGEEVNIEVMGSGFIRITRKGA